MRYADYLRSAQWRSKRDTVMYRAGGRCEFCGAVAEHVHHVRYPKILGEEPLSDLVAVCGGCHEKAHGIRGEARMRELKHRDFHGSDVMYFDEEGVIWLDFSTVMLALGLVDQRGKVEQRSATGLWRSVDEDSRRVEQVPDDTGAMVNRYFVTREGAYHVAILAETPKSKPFRRMVTHEMIPAVAETGRYVTGQGLQPVTARETALREMHRHMVQSAEVIGGVLDEMDSLRQRQTQIAAEAGETRRRLVALEEKGVRHAEHQAAVSTVLMRCAYHNISLGKEEMKNVGIEARRLCIARGDDPDNYPKVLAGALPARQWRHEDIDGALRSLGFLSAQ